MPQLDKVTFLSQFMWLCIFFFGFYLTLVKHFLPKISRLLKVRHRKMNVPMGGVRWFMRTRAAKWIEELNQADDKVILDRVKLPCSWFSAAYRSTSDWVSSVVETTRKTSFKPLNEAYIGSLYRSQEEHGILWMDLNVLIAPGSRSHLHSGAKPTSGLKREALYASLSIKTLLSKKVN